MNAAAPTDPFFAPTPTLVREYTVLANKREGLEKAFRLLLRRAKRLGVAPFEYAFSTPFTTQVRCDMTHPGAIRTEACVAQGTPCTDLSRCIHRVVSHHRFIVQQTLTLTGEGPRLHGWAFRATLQHLGDENLLRAAPGYEAAAPIPVLYRTRGPVCDHCGTARRRIDTLLVEHADGRWLQIGRNCIVDFLGHDRAESLAAMGELLTSASDLADDAGHDEDGGSGGGGGRGRSCEALVEYLGYAATAVRMWGWLSRGAADKMGGGRRATAERVDNARHNPYARPEERLEPRSAEDADRAQRVAAWAEGITDAEVEKSDYMHNLRAIARSGIVDRRSTGLACSMIAAYDKALGRETERAARAAASVYFGTPKKRETFTLTVTGTSSWEGMYGVTHFYRFLDTVGNVAVWKSSTLVSELEVGGIYEIKATVKAHAEWRGSDGKGRPVLQTVLARAALVRVVAAPPGSAPHVVEGGAAAATEEGS